MPDLTLPDALTDTPAEPPPDVAAPAAVLPPGRRGDQFSQQQASDAEIGTAVGQLGAGQPVTALPTQSWSLSQAQAFNAKLDAYDKQAAAARSAAEQAARDAALLDQMSRVAKTTKDIQVVRQQQDVIGFRNAVAGGTHPVHALSLFPLAATSPLVAAAKADEPISAPTLGTVPGVGNYLVDAAGKPHFQPGGGQAPAHALGERVPVKGPNGEDLGFVVATGPNTGRYEKPESLHLTASQQVQVHRARISAITSQLSNMNISDAKARQKFIDDKMAQLEQVSNELAGIQAGAPSTPAAVAAPDFVKNPKTGKYERAKKP